MVNSTAKTLVTYKVKNKTNTITLNGWYPETKNGLKYITDQIIAETELDIESKDIQIVKVKYLGKLGRE